MKSFRALAIDTVAEFLHTSGPPLNSDDAAIAIVDALETDGLEVVPSVQLRGAVEALRDLAAAARKFSTDADYRISEAGEEEFVEALEEAERLVGGQ